MEEGRNKSQREMDNNRQATRSQAKQAPGKAGPGSACAVSNKVLHGMPTFSLRTNTHTHIKTRKHAHACKRNEDAVEDTAGQQQNQ